MNQLSFRLKQQKIALRLLAALAIATAMHAGTTGAMPWESPLRTIATSLTGPVASPFRLSESSPPEQR